MSSFSGSVCSNCQGRLILVEINYHGTGEDIVECKDCNRVYCVTYKVDKLTRLPDWEEHE